MAGVRRWQVPAAEQIEIDGQVWPHVRAQEIAQELTKLAVMLETAGGHGGVMTQRIPTGQPDESVTVGVVITWMPLTTSKSRPEPDARTEALIEKEPIVIAREDPPETDEGEFDMRDADDALAETVLLQGDGVGDGLRYDPAGEDVSEIPAHMLSS